MIKIMIVAGSKTSSITEYMEKTSGGSLDIVGSFSSFRFDKDAISSNYYNLDKLVYLLDVGDIKQEMEALFELMSKGISFKAKEIILFYNEETVSQGLQFFSSIMTDLSYSNYTMNGFTGDISLGEIYKKILDIVPEEDTMIKRKVVYRVERGETSKRGYDPDRFKGRIVPAEDDSIALYESMKKASSKAETGRPIIDSAVLNLEKVEIHSDKLNADSLKNFIIVVGKERSGLTTFGSNLAKCVQRKEKTISYIDLSSHSACGLFRDDRIISNTDVIMGEEFKKSSKVFVYNGNLKTGYTKLCFLRFLLSNRNKFLPTDYIFIETNYDLLEDLKVILGECVKSIMYVTESVKREVLYTKSVFSPLYDSYIYLNQLTAFTTPKDRYRPVEVKNMFKCKVIDTIDFNKKVDISPLVLGVER